MAGQEAGPDLAGLGNATHQRLLRAMTAYYAAQPWARAFLVFGSVSRGNWDDESDLDLDVVISDAATLDPVGEAARLCAAIGERPALIAPRRPAAVEVALESLAQFSIRYHPLSATSPNILDSMRLLWSAVAIEEIRVAGERNRVEASAGADALLALAVRALLNGQIALRRARLWSALASLEEARDLLLALYAEARALPRPLPAFECEADTRLRAAFAALAASLDTAAIRVGLLAACDLLEGDPLARLTNNSASLTAGERYILAVVRARLQALS
ncbi:MAG TPA: hypothetical protein VF808_01680 [Ktedonobacterales bacterium]